jgi:hypothetical protein
MSRKELISDLESFLNDCFQTINNLTTYQRINENDARVTFFKHLVNVIDSTILSFLMAHKYLGDENWWIQIQKEYNLSTRPIPFYREFDYHDQVVTNSFFLLMFSCFESSIRLIVKRYDPKFYESQRDFNPLSKGLIRQLKLDNKDKFIDLVSSIRNSIHTNGLYVPRGSTKNKRIVWNNTIFGFDEDKPIKIKDLWLNLIPISREVYKIFSNIINTDEIKRIGYYDDPTESIK